jgi:hypothetical protein
VGEWAGAYDFGWKLAVDGVRVGERVLWMGVEFEIMIINIITYIQFLPVLEYA